MGSKILFNTVFIISSTCNKLFIVCCVYKTFQFPNVVENEVVSFSGMETFRLSSIRHVATGVRSPPKICPRTSKKISKVVSNIMSIGPFISY